MARTGYAVLPRAVATGEDEVPEVPGVTQASQAQRCRRRKAAGLCALTVAAAGLLAAIVLHGGGRSAPVLRRGGEAEVALVEEEEPWCTNGMRPRALWQPDPARPKVFVKVLTYNLWWWNLFGKRHGNHGSAGKLIAESGKPRPYDLMGFQECEDPQRVLRDAGLENEYTAFQGLHTLCMAFRKASWSLEARGHHTVAEDRKGFFGERAVQWMRLRHNTGARVFFMNHHGPLPINTGGICGGQSTAYNILKIIGDNARPGDGIVLAGDFNANAESEELQLIRQYLLHVYTGHYLSGIDNIFSNVDGLQVVSTKTLTGGGSDHDALNAIVEVGRPPAQPKETTTTSTSTVTTVAVTTVATTIPTTPRVITTTTMMTTAMTTTTMTTRTMTTTTMTTTTRAASTSRVTASPTAEIATRMPTTPTVAAVRTTTTATTQTRVRVTTATSSTRSTSSTPPSTAASTATSTTTPTASSAARAARIRSPEKLATVQVQEQPRGRPPTAEEGPGEAERPARAPSTTHAPSSTMSLQGSSWNWWWPFPGSGDHRATTAEAAHSTAPTTTQPVGCDAKCLPGQELSTSCRASILWYSKFRFHSHKGACGNAHKLVQAQCSGCFGCTLPVACPEEAGVHDCAEGDAHCQPGVVDLPRPSEG